MRFGVLTVILAVVFLAGTSGLSSAQTSPTSVQLEWTTPGDDGMTGTAAQFDMRYSTSAITSANFASATRWTVTPVPSASGTIQTTTVAGLQPNTTYWFAIKAADEVPNWSTISNVVSHTTAVVSDPTRPAMVANLAVTAATENSASLGWTAVGDDSLTGTATSYDIRYSTAPITTANWASATPVSGEPAPAVSGTAQSFTVNGLSRQITYYFALKVTDDGGNVSALSNVPSVTTPDQTRPASITDLVVGFVWMGGTIATTDPTPGRREF